MKSFFYFAVAFSLAAMASLLHAAASGSVDSPKPAPKSVFVIPSSPKDGRDPFYPNSSRPYESAPGAKNVDNTMLHSLKVGSIMKAEDGRLLAIIGTHTFAPGEEGTVINDNGQRINIRCISIDLKAGTVTVESNGARATLTFSDKP